MFKKKLENCLGCYYIEDLIFNIMLLTNFVRKNPHPPSVRKNPQFVRNMCFLFDSL